MIRQGRPTGHSRWSPMHMPALRTELAGATIRMGGDRGRRFAHRLRASELYWVSRDMGRVALDASTDLPDWTPAAVLPAPLGLLAWEETLPPMRAAALDLDRPWPVGPLGVPVAPAVPVAAVVWAHTGGQVHLTVLGRAQDVQTALGSDIRSALGSELVPVADLVPLPATEPIPPSLRGEAAGLVAMLGATWILMQQPTVVSPRTVYPKVGARPARQPSGALVGVSIIDLRRMDTARDDRDAGEPGRVYHHRWVVRGHWRQQAYGPGRSQRRPTWVPSYIKGPDGAPLLATEHVHVWRR